MSRVVFIDTETTSLRPDRQAWEIAMVVRDPGAPMDVEESYFIDALDLPLGNAELKSLAIGRFYERHPDFNPDAAGVVRRERDALVRVEYLTRDAHLVGAVPSFDADVLATRMRLYGLLPAWHYHLVDVEALAVGYLHGLAAHGHSSSTCTEARDCSEPDIGLPWSSARLSTLIGVPPMPPEHRHTAIGDARWARHIYDVVTAGK